MNFIFISPHFPVNYYLFCEELRRNGVNVLGIGDCEYDYLEYNLKHALTEYYKVDSLENYDQMMRAVAYFTFKYGKIDWLESNNEYWLLQDARLRTDFNIATGYQKDEIERLRSKYVMKSFYQKAGVPAAPCCRIETPQSCRDFIDTHGYPIVVKPECGLGAQRTWRISNEEELERLLEKEDLKGFVAESYVNGTICSYDAIVDSSGEPIFESGNVTPLSIMDIVNEKKDCYFYIEKQLPEDVREAGRRCVKAFSVRSRFIHFEFFRLKEDMPGVAKKGELAALEVNMRPSGGFTPDMLNFANSTNVYKIWADMIAFDKSTLTQGAEHYYCIYAGRRDCNSHLYEHNQVLSAYRTNITMSDRMPKVLAEGMGDQMYIARFREKAEMDEFVKYVIS